MAETAIDCLMENLKRLMNSKIDLILDEKDQIQSIYQEFESLRTFLKDLEEKLINDPEKASNLVTRIRDVANKAEDTIDLFVVNVVSKNITLKEKDTDMAEKIGRVCDPSLNLGNVKEDIEAIKTELMEIFDEKSKFIGAIPEGKSYHRNFSIAKTTVGEKEIVVGFEDEALKIKEQLTREQMRQLDIISIVGMPGLGKTTLARKVYNDPLIIYHFSIREWINVSQKYQKRDLLLALLNSVRKHKNDIDGMTDEKLCDVLRKRLKDKRYLIVMDDIWDDRAWVDLKSSFPDDNKGSRIIFTSRFKDVTFHAKSDSHPFCLRFLTEDESWDLFKQKVFRGEAYPPELMDMGKEMLEHCSGLPLAIVLLAGFLASIEKTKDKWEEVGKTLNSRFLGELCMQTLALSYNHLPYHLKPCFLYFATFPEDFEIPKRRLKQLWIAEGFIQKIEEKSLEDVAEEYLMDLIGRNLILVSKRSSNGGIKTCSIHDLLRDFCLRKAEEDYFLQQISLDESISSSSSNHFSSMRRMSFNSDFFLKTFVVPSDLNTRSFLCFVSEHINFKPIQFTSQSFKLLKVLDISSVDFTMYPSEIEHLVLLRYLAFGIMWRTWRHFAHGKSTQYLPSSISNLWNLETLIIRTSVSSIMLPQSIWTMVNLRHLCIIRGGKYVIEMPCLAHSSLLLDSLLTVSYVDPWSFQDLLVRTPNLRKLAFRGDMVSSRCLKFPDIHFLDHLQKLKLYNQHHIEQELSCNLGIINFPPNLKHLTLKETFLKWDEMSTLAELLPNLEVLKLLRDACKGLTWKTNGVFPRLKFLKLKGLIIIDWEVSRDHFPNLQRLVLVDCHGFEKIPSEIGYIPTLRTIEVFQCDHYAVDSARQIKEEQESEGNNQLQIIESDNWSEQYLCLDICMWILKALIFVCLSCTSQRE